MGKRACCLGICISTQVIDVTEEPRMPLKIGKPKARHTSRGGGGGWGALGYFLGGYVPPGTPNWHPRLKIIFP